MSIERIKALREERARLAKQAREILDRAATEKRELTGEENAKWEALMADIDRGGEEIRRLERIGDVESDLSRSQGVIAGRLDTGPTDDAGENRGVSPGGAFRSWLRGGMASLTPGERSAMAFKAADLTPEQRALSVGTASAGGYLVPEDFRRQIEDAMKAFGGMREVATILPTASGATLPMPTSNDTGNTGAILAENAQVAEQDTTFGSVSLGAYMYTSKLVRVSLQLLQDSAFSVDGWLSAKLGERLARILNAHFTTGTGSAQPNGVVTAATLGKTGASGQTTSVTYADFVDLQHSVDPSYRRNARWMMNDSTIKAIKKLLDSQNRPLWSPGIAVKEPDTILGVPYVVNQDVAAMAASAKSILFGDFSKYIIRDVLDVQLLRLQERYADYLQVGFLAFSRHDGNLLDAGTNPIKYYINSAT